MTAETTAAVTLTPRAIGKIRQTFEREGVFGGLRLGVLGGGCSGLSYQFKFEVKPRERDQVLDFDGVKIFIDPKSLIYLRGLTLDTKRASCSLGSFSKIRMRPRTAGAARASPDKPS